MNPLDLRTGYEHGAQPLGGPRLPLVKLGKVISVHREDHSVELQMLDGGPNAQVPVLTSMMGTNYGFMGLVAPSRDPKQPARKTYPESAEGAIHSTANTGKSGRDQYAVVLQAEGSGFGTAKMYVVGFLPPQVSEMLFARHEMNAEGNQSAVAEREGEFDDLMLYRHPSDMQVTMDKKGKLSAQHPNGTRITMGTDVGHVDLIKKDYDALYELRHNLSENVHVYVEAVDAEHGKRADILTSAGGNIHAAVYNASGEKRADLVLTDAGLLVGTVYEGATGTAFIKLTADGKLEGFAVEECYLHDETGDFVRLSNGDVEVHAVNDLKLTAGSNINIEAGASINATAGTAVLIDGGALIAETAGIITLN